jgi:hypothetical protein
VNLLEKLAGRFRRKTRRMRRRARERRVEVGDLIGRKVDFVIAGVVKGGTTALDAYMRLHPEICMAEQKEPHFFDRDRNFEDGEPDYRKYQAYFQPSGRQWLLGEATPTYTYVPEALPRLSAYNPKAKIIVILRNPITRAYSHWNEARSEKRDLISFSEAIRTEDERLPGLDPVTARRRAYVGWGFYTQHIQRLWQSFPKEQTRVIKNEDLRSNHQETLNGLFAFLGVEQLPSIKPLIALTGEYASPMLESDRQYLRELYEAEIRSLEKMVGWDCSTWLA